MKTSTISILGAMTVATALGLGGCYAGGSDMVGANEDGGEAGDDGAVPPGEDCAESKVGPPLLRRLTRTEFERTLRDIYPEATVDWDGVALGEDPIAESGFRNDAQALVVSQQTAEAVLETAEDLASRVSEASVLGQLLPCSQGAADAACAATYIETYGRRLFRRPLEVDEVEEYLELHATVSADADFGTGIHWVTVALIQSPRTLYRAEIGAPAQDEDTGGGVALDQWELATALAYTFSGTTPTEALLDAADAGELADPEARVEWARELLQTPGGRTVMRQFFRDWTRYGLVETTVKQNHGSFDAVAASMMGETETFFESMVYDRDANVADLLTTPTTYLDPILAEFYGYGAGADGFVEATRPDPWGLGVLVQGALLAGNAQTDGSSPTRRGLLVFHQFLCQHVEIPPANIPPVTPPEPGAKTTRERYEDAHSADPFCKSCHQHFDPIGFAFEHFDELGRYRETESGLEIDATGTMVLPVEKREVSFDGAAELAIALAEAPEVTNCVSSLMSDYAYGGGGGQSCLAGDAQMGLRDGEYGLLEYMAQLAGQPHFAQRKASD